MSGTDILITFKKAAVDGDPMHIRSLCKSRLQDKLYRADNYLGDQFNYLCSSSYAPHKVLITDAGEEVRKAVQEIPSVKSVSNYDTSLTRMIDIARMTLNQNSISEFLLR